MSASTSSAGSAAGAVRAAMASALRAELGGVPVFEGAAPAAVLPRVEVGEPQAIDWSAKEMRGRELRTAVTVRVAEGQRGRMAGLCEGAERAGEGLAGEIGAWRVAGAVFLRARGFGEKSGAMAMLVEHRVRVVEL